LQCLEGYCVDGLSEDAGAPTDAGYDAGFDAGGAACTRDDQCDEGYACAEEGACVQACEPAGEIGVVPCQADEACGPDGACALACDNDACVADGELCERDPTDENFNVCDDATDVTSTCERAALSGIIRSSDGPVLVNVESISVGSACGPDSLVVRYRALVYSEVGFPPDQGPVVTELSEIGIGSEVVSTHAPVIGSPRFFEVDFALCEDSFEGTRAIGVTTLDDKRANPFCFDSGFPRCADPGGLGAFPCVTGNVWLPAGTCAVPCDSQACAISGELCGRDIDAETFNTCAPADDVSGDCGAAAMSSQQRDPGGPVIVEVERVAVLGACVQQPLMLDAGVDGGNDAGVDGGDDAGVDGGNDAGADAGVDGGVDAGVDSGSDAGVDAGVDGGSGDAGADAGLDAGVDGGGDAGEPAEQLVRYKARVYAVDGFGDNPYTDLKEIAFDGDPLLTFDAPQIEPVADAPGFFDVTFSLCETGDAGDRAIAIRDVNNDGSNVACFRSALASCEHLGRVSDGTCLDTEVCQADGACGEICDNDDCAPQGELCVRATAAADFNHCAAADALLGDCANAMTSGILRDADGPTIYDVSYSQALGGCGVGTIGEYRARLWSDDPLPENFYFDGLVSVSGSGGVGVTFDAPTLVADMALPGYYDLTFTLCETGQADLAVFVKDDDGDRSNVACFASGQ
jgi:hypothetical protein